MACFVKYMQKTYRVVRMKNRFSDDVVEKISAAELQQQFYAAESWGYEDGSSEASGSTYGRSTYEKMYRDVLLNVEVPREAGPPFIAEVQVPKAQKERREASRDCLLSTYFAAAPPPPPPPGLLPPSPPPRKSGYIELI